MLDREPAGDANRTNRPVAVRSPRFDWAAALDAEQQRVKWPMILLEGTIGADGHLTEAHIIRGCGNAALEARSLEAIRNALYRPARGKDGYVPAKITLTVNIHLR